MRQLSTAAIAPRPMRVSRARRGPANGLNTLSASELNIGSVVKRPGRVRLSRDNFMFLDTPPDRPSETVASCEVPERRSTFNAASPRDMVSFSAAMKFLRTAGSGSSFCSTRADPTSVWPL